MRFGAWIKEALKGRMIKEESVGGMFGKVVEFLQTTPLPASIVSKSGEIIFLNQQMLDIIDLDESSSVYKCSWMIEKGSGPCPDCAEAPVLEGRCFVTHENSDVTLLTAVRVQQANNALVRLYSNGASLSPNETEIHTNRLLKIASPDMADDKADGPVDFNSDWLCGASLWRIVQNTIKSRDTHPMKVENRVKKTVNVNATNPMLVGRTISKILFELYAMKNQGPVMIENLEPDSPPASANDHVVSFTVKSLKTPGKGRSSELTAINLRLKLFCDRLVQATGYCFPEPSLFQRDGLLTILLPVADLLESIDNQFSGFSNGPSSSLSFREQEIVDMVRAGYDNNAISSSLGITHATVKQHLKAIYRKLDVNNRIDLIFR
ncbi:MAG TPA: LuxR family transcriptional regulator [Nitrospirae bacterium]|nr:LuxR family transcriptional regulator [Nitrospirota bacterium]